VIKKLFNSLWGAVGLRSSSRHRRGRLAAFAAASAGALVVSALISPVAAEARPGGTDNLTRLSAAEIAAAAPAPTKSVDSGAPTPARVAYPWPSASPNPEHWETKRWTQQQATDWVNACPAQRFCTWIRESNGVTYALFQFYRCQEYALSKWLGTTNFYNHQNVRVELRGSRHEHLRYLSSGQKFITNWDPVFYINLCA